MPQSLPSNHTSSNNSSDLDPPWDRRRTGYSPCLGSTGQDSCSWTSSAATLTNTSPDFNPPWAQKQTSHALFSKSRSSSKNTSASTSPDFNPSWEHNQIGDNPYLYQPPSSASSKSKSSNNSPDFYAPWEQTRPPRSYGPIQGYIGRSMSTGGDNPERSSRSRSSQRKDSTVGDRYRKMDPQQQPQLPSHQRTVDSSTTSASTPSNIREEIFTPFHPDAYDGGVWKPPESRPTGSATVLPSRETTNPSMSNTVPEPRSAAALPGTMSSRAKGKKTAPTDVESSSSTASAPNARVPPSAPQKEPASKLKRLKGMFKRDAVDESQYEKITHRHWADEGSDGEGW